ncbi:hypothetical protein [Cellulomonas soli]|uniref:Uncharacterized protein n=1 Tax=Cellulomonas soli TaxID=931535 RepID=A0A512PHH7_9CELL|nr:hypothetical protein [Cellulomonas soli]NYI59164.1 hypothetical protein [Cellulomonas soli]GEP70668.1 hypothetical protein CSO01_33830 [Cellulomonas soli]
MDTYVGRRTTEGQWVALGAHAELMAHHEEQDVVEVYTPSRQVARVTISRVGRPFTRAGVVLGYGYLTDAADAEGAA